MIEGLHIGIPTSKFGATPPVPRSPSLRASSFRSSDGSIALLRRTSSTSSIIPESDSTLDNTLKGENFKIAIVKILIKLRLTSWKLSEAENLVIKNIASALTNCVYLLVLDNQKLLLRVYGPNVLHLIDRDYETSVLARLAHHRIGPRLLGQFKNGRIEQWLESVEVTPHELRDPTISRYIARRMREFHDFVTLLPAEMFKVSASVNLTCWMAALSKDDLDEATRQFLQHIDLYRAHVEGKEGEIVFCHNDLQYGNLLRTKGDEHNCLAVIDFEFAGPNPRSFDLVNHFIEWMANYHESPSHVLDPAKYPTYEETENFLTEYIRFGKIIARREDPIVHPEEVQQLRDSMDLMRAMSHAQWALWGIIQALPDASPSSTTTTTTTTTTAMVAEHQDTAPTSKPKTTVAAPRALMRRQSSAAKGLASPLATGMKSPFLPPMSPSTRATSRPHRPSSHKSPGSAAFLQSQMRIPTEEFSLGESAFVAPPKRKTSIEVQHKELDRDVLEAGLDDDDDNNDAAANNDDGAGECALSTEWSDDEDDGFDYTGYANQRIGLFYGELLRLGLIGEQEVPEGVDVIKLFESAFKPSRRDKGTIVDGASH